MKRSGLIFNQLLSGIDAPIRRRNNILLLLSLFLAGLFLFLVLRDLDWYIFLNTIKNVEYGHLIIIFIWGTTTYFIRALRLRFLLANEKKLQIKNVFWANMAGYLGNNILPARAGELIRATYLARQNSISVSFAFAVGIVERIMDLIVLVIIGSLALSYTQNASSVFQNAMKVVFLVGLIGLTIIFILPRFKKSVEPILALFSRLNSEYKVKIEDFIIKFLNGLKPLHNFWHIMQFITLTGLIWAMDAFGLLMLSYILEMPLLLHQTFVLLAALGLSSAIPSTPGYVGVYQFVAVTVLVPFGVSKPNALAYILISQVINYLLVGFWGLISLWQFNKKS